MPFHRLFWLFFAVLATSSSGAQSPKPVAKLPISADDRAKIHAGMELLQKTLTPLAERTFGPDVTPSDALADAAIALKAARWMMRHEEFYFKDSTAKTLKILELGIERGQRLTDGKHPWTSRKGGVSRGFTSKIDGSIQPYAVYVPASYDGVTAIRLDVILHGRDVTLTEVKFLMAHEGQPYPKGETGLLLHVFGRGNNGYRWAGETDVFEAIDAVKRNYRVDDRRIVLRGFSMGGAGAWHLGLHRPFAWCAVEAGAGFTETRIYAKLKDIPDYQEKTLRIYDAVDYAQNARNVPIVGYGGEDDPQKQASENILNALTASGVKFETEGLITRGEGLDFSRILGAKTGHAVDAESAKIFRVFRDDRAEKGRPDRPRPIRFVTYTLKYRDAGWISIDSMKELYKKATVEADIVENTAVVKVENITILGIEREAADNVQFGEQIFPLRTAVEGRLPMVYFRLTENGWETLDYNQSLALIMNKGNRKRPNLQGPIDDAFTGPFLCVRGTGKPWNEKAEGWSKRRLEQFAEEWSAFYRAELPIKNDADVTTEDAESRHLILFGDPGSNRLIARVVGELPISWTKNEFKIAGNAHSAMDDVPVLISANPLNKLRYVVLNSGHTFGATEFSGTNALLYPKLGDWAVWKIDGEAVSSGFFDERWK